MAGRSNGARQAQLWIARGDFLMPRKWDGMIELRRLEVHSDNLADLSHRSRGFFVNTIGKF